MPRCNCGKLAHPGLINVNGKNYCVECAKALILLIQQGLKPYDD